MNKADTNELTEYWHRETRYVNDKVDEAFKDAQDHAYALGLKRGKEEVTDLAKRLVAARDAEDQREWVAILDALYKVGAGDTATEGHNAKSEPTARLFAQVGSTDGLGAVSPAPTFGDNDAA